MNEIIWILRPKRENLDYIELVVKIANHQDINLSDYEIGQVESVVHSFKDEIINYLLEHGFSSLVNSDLLLEQIVAKGTLDNKIIAIIQRYLDKIEMDNELIIVDPFFFSNPKNPNYVSVLVQILDKYLATIDTIRIITGTIVKAPIKTQIISALLAKKPSLIIDHKQNEDYHDRYWISGAREKGIVIGTSLNSLGNKVTLVDRLNTSDVRDAIIEMTKDGLL